jgi:hypothetical protein
MENDELRAACERINSGAQIATIEPSQIEHVWEVVSHIPIERRQNTTIGLTAARGNPDFAPSNPDQQFALMARYALLDALVERGTLNDYMDDESLRKRAFAAAATIPCDKNDLGEALAQRTLRNSTPDVVERTKEEARQAGWDLDRPKVGEKFIEWIHSHC